MSLPSDSIHRFHDSLVIHATSESETSTSEKPHIGLVGHLDTVRTAHDGPPRVEGDRLYGCGASDMKAGLAIMIELLERLPLDDIPCALSLVFYEREEGPFEENRLGPILDHFTALHKLDLAICLEPSQNEIQLGCVGSVHATVIFSGETAHSARPWQGDNACYKAADFLAELGSRAPHIVEIDGHSFYEVLTPTLIEGGRGRNVVPDRVEVNVNYRFAPGRTPEHAVEHLKALVAGRAEVIATDLSPSGRPHATHPLVMHLAQCGVASVKTKQAWTDVARFDALDVPAVNLGPGIGAQAHQRNEYTDLPLLVDGYHIFERFLQTIPSKSLLSRHSEFF